MNRIATPGITILLCLATACGAFAQNAYTDPVGVFNLEIVGGTIAPYSVPLFRIPADRGVSTGVGTATVTDTSKAWTVGQFVATTLGDERYYLEFTDGAADGKCYEITANTATELTLDALGEDLTAEAAAGDAYMIIPFYRIRDLFGAGDPADVKLQGGNDAALADNVLLWNGSLYDTLYFSTFFGENRWRISGTSEFAEDALIWPGEGFFIRRNAGTDVTISVSGAVPIRQRVTRFQGGQFTFIGMEFPADVTLVDADLLTTAESWNGGSDSTVADLLYAWNGSFFDIHYYSTFFGENIWRQAGDGGPSGSLPLEAGKGYFVLERDATSVLDWTRTLPYSYP